MSNFKLEFADIQNELDAIDQCVISFTFEKRESLESLITRFAHLESYLRRHYGNYDVNKLDEICFRLRDREITLRDRETSLRNETVALLQKELQEMKEKFQKKTEKADTEG